VSSTLQAGTGERLPRGPHKLSRTQVTNHQRERILAAVVEVVAAKGYAQTTIGDITSAARVSRDTLYALFAGKEDCFLAAHDEITRELLRRLVLVGTSQPSFVEGMRDGVRAYLSFWAERDDAARFWTIETAAAGPNGLAHRERALERFARLFRTVADRARREQPQLPPIPDVVPRAITASTVDLTAQYVHSDRTQALPELEADLLYLWLMGLAGHAVAAQAIALTS
jgi:AcrR family transcriptional regulator